MVLTKVTKSQVKARMKRLGAGEKLVVWLCPSKCRPNPDHPFNVAYRAVLEKYGEWLPDSGKYRSFDYLVDSFAYYNCNNELGNTVHFYIEE